MLPQSSDITTFGSAAPRLAAVGWSPIPLVGATKRPAMQGWPDVRYGWEVADLADAVVSYAHDYACGVALSEHHVAVDADFLDPEQSEEVSHAADIHLGKSPLNRIGRAPKFLRVYRASERLGGPEWGDLQNRSDRHQFAAYGVHEKTAKPYIWTGPQLWQIESDSDDIPVISRADLNCFKASVEHLLPRRSARRGTHAATDDGTPKAWLKGLLRTMGWSYAARMFLGEVDEGERHESVLALIIGARMHAPGEIDDVIPVLARQRRDILELVELNGLARPRTGAFLAAAADKEVQQVTDDPKRVDSFKKAERLVRDDGGIQVRVTVGDCHALVGPGLTCTPAGSEPRELSDTPLTRKVLGLSAGKMHFEVVRPNGHDAETVDGWLGDPGKSLVNPESGGKRSSSLNGGAAPHTGRDADGRPGAADPRWRPGAGPRVDGRPRRRGDAARRQRRPVS